MDLAPGPERPLHPLHFGDLGWPVTRCCRIDTVQYSIKAEDPTKGDRMLKIARRVGKFFRASGGTPPPSFILYRKTFFGIRLEVEGNVAEVATCNAG